MFHLHPFLACITRKPKMRNKEKLLAVQVCQFTLKQIDNRTDNNGEVVVPISSYPVKVVVFFSMISRSMHGFHEKVT